jgi:hypothetical protein
MTDSGQIESNFKAWLDGQRTDCNRPNAVFHASSVTGWFRDKAELKGFEPITRKPTSTRVG